MRIIKSSLPGFTENSIASVWPAQWIAKPNPEGSSYAIAYRLRFNLEEDCRICIHLSADQRFRLFVDGVLEGEGPDRCDSLNWHFHSHELDMAAGEHCLVAMVWTLDKDEGLIPGAQVTLRHGFILAAESPFTDMLSTGIASWEQKQLSGLNFVHNGLGGAGSYSGGVVDIDAEKFPWEIEKGEGEGWESCQAFSPGRSRLGSFNWGMLDSPLLTPNSLPPQFNARHPVQNLRYAGSFDGDINKLFVSEDLRCLEDEQAYQAALQDSQPLRIGPGKKQWLLFDLDNYFCGYPELQVSSGHGAVVHWHWAESLYEEHQSNDGQKGNRNEICGKKFFGRGDTFRGSPPSPGAAFTSFWWSCGRYIALIVETADEALVIEKLEIRECRYPFEMKAELCLENEAFEKSKSIMWRSLQMCSHETFMDCPYYEQMNYAGDTRVQALISYVMSGDDRLARHCIKLFASSIMANGLTQSRYPSVSQQVIPQFSLHWIGMLYEFALWRGQPEFVKNLLTVSRSIIETYLSHVHEDGLLRCPDGWDWIDWAWLGDRAYPKGPEGANAVNHLQLVYTLGLASRLEDWVGRKGLAAFYEREKVVLFENACKAFWNEDRGLFASTTRQENFDEHSQCFATLSGMLDVDKRDRMRKALPASTDIDRSTYYFQFYLFSTFAELGLHKHILKNFEKWGRMSDKGLRTTLERADPSRSDCHAWSAHPLYHAVVSLCGIQPEGFGFSRVSICPALGVLPAAKTRIPHRLGDLGVQWQKIGKVFKLELEIPAGLDATLRLPNKIVSLGAGRQEFEIEAINGGLVPVGESFC